MTKRIGVSLSATELRAVLIDRGDVRWRGSEPLGDSDALTEALARLLARIPASWRRPTVTVAVGREWVQVKRLRGLPAAGSARVLTALVRQNEQSFFLKRRTPCAIPAVELRAEGEVWGAAFDRQVIDAIEQGSRLTALAVRRVVPAATLGDLSSAVPPVANRADLAADAAAIAAAMAPRRVGLAWRIGPDVAQKARRARAMRVAAVVGSSAALVLAAVGPGVRAARFGRAADAELSRRASQRVQLARTELDLQTVSRRLARIDEFERAHGEVARLLAALSESTPDSTAMLTLRIDSVEGALTVVAPRAAEVLPAVAEAHGVFAPRIVGSVTREVVGGVSVERAAIRFLRVRPRLASRPRASR